jgi:hypothetical protein
MNRDELIEKIEDYAIGQGLTFNNPDHSDDDDGDYDIELHRGYSGRGMYGKTSSVAIRVAQYTPRVAIDELTEMLGSRDQLGLDIIIYTRW